MSDLEIALKVDEYARGNLNDIPFDKGLPLLQDFVWALGRSVGKDGPTVMKIYFDWKTKNS